MQLDTLSPQESSERVSILSQRQLQTKGLNIHDLSGIRTRDSCNRAAAEIHFKQRGCWDQLCHWSSSLVIISIQPEGRFRQEPEPSQATGMALAHCILGSFLGVGCHCFPPPLDAPTFASRCLHVQATWETSISERRNYGREMAGQFCLWFRLPRKPRVLWHAARICDMGDGFTSPPRKACCEFFRPKNPTASARIEPAILGIRGQHANH